MIIRKMILSESKAAILLGVLVNVSVVLKPLEIIRRGLDCTRAINWPKMVTYI